MVLKKYEDDHIKITVEEKHNGDFIATYWVKDCDDERDRQVHVYETFGGAMDHAFNVLGGYAATYIEGKK